MYRRSTREASRTRDREPTRLVTSPLATPEWRISHHLRLRIGGFSTNRSGTGNWYAWDAPRRRTCHISAVCLSAAVSARPPDRQLVRLWRATPSHASLLHRLPVAGRGPLTRARPPSPSPRDDQTLAGSGPRCGCLLYTSDAADEED